MNSHVLQAYLCDGNGGGAPMPVDASFKNPSNDSFVWIHLDATHPDTKEWLTSELLHLDHYIIDALLDVESRPRMTQIKNGALLILRGANLNDNADPEDMVSIRLWVESNRVISVRRRRLRAVEDIVESMENGQGPDDTGQFVCMLMARLLSRIEPVLNKLDEDTDNVEEAILASGDVSLREAIIGIRKQAILFRRYMIPQREAIDQCRMARIGWLDDDHRRYLQENYNHVTRYVEDLDAVRERAQIVKDELANMLADKLNKNMYMLSVIAAVFLPLGFLTGLLGINVGGIPGTDNVYAFAIFCAILIAVVIFQIILFKKMKWF